MIDVLKRLSDADAIASCEDQVRDILYETMKDACDEILYDSLGSIIFHKKGKSIQPIKMMFCAHMDEVGFIVRHISDIGFVYVLAVGGVLDKSKEMQLVRITTDEGNRIEGLLNVTKDQDGHVKDMYIDVGCENAQEVKDLGIDVGNMVCFASSMRELSSQNVYMGKAMDDRSGCYVLTQALSRLQNDDNDLYFVGTSSEEVGMRGAKTVTQLIQPDIVFVLDVANHPELERNFKNHRQIGQGPMIVHYDKTLAPNRQLVSYVKSLAQKHSIPYQSDMLSGGGTDGGNAHLEAGGRLTLVLGIPLRYCHGSYSMVHGDDLEHLIQLVCALAQMKYIDFINMKDFWRK